MSRAERISAFLLVYGIVSHSSRGGGRKSSPGMPEDPRPPGPRPAALAGTYATGAAMLRPEQPPHAGRRRGIGWRRRVRRLHCWSPR